jgi:hypothetical protein
MESNDIESTTAWGQSSNNETKRTLRQSSEQEEALDPLHDRERFNKSLRRLMSIRDDRDHDHNVIRSVGGFSLAPTHHTVLIKASLKEIVVATSPHPLNLSSHALKPHTLPLALSNFAPLHPYKACI